MNGSATPSPVLCAGRLYCDLVFTGAPQLPRLGAEVFAEGLSLHAGGGAFITAATIAALGQPSTLFAMLPGSPFDVVVKQDIADAMVDDHLCQAAAGDAAPQITIAMPCNDDRAFLSHKSGRAIPGIENLSNDWKHLHIGEVRTLVEHSELIQFARSAGMTISLDCGWDEEVLNDGIGMRSLIDSVDVFLPNEAEFARLRSSGLGETVACLTVVKCGANGAKALTDCGWMMAPVKSVPVIDATGAGDAFNGGFLTAWLGGQSVEFCLNAGNRCGAAVVQSVGGHAGLQALRGNSEMRKPDAAE